ncbi:phosphoribosylformylglycinamidine cyclo-ligase [Candidatus Peregrinibacteria bacterium CG11_big_fil_rev_8_21_14_0_20_46_8]|nr:MAG: phosphoribosylformylglycinamidine cyclo-ligase [Candidatus Peregrinibacteria bacterium CG11_big_fil_rev_8_21_14_0_20_46_8]
MEPLQRVDYNALDAAKNAFIEASRSTLQFAQKYGFVPDERLGASANVFQLDLKPFLKSGAEQLFITLLPEGLGTADDARPDDLSDAEAITFWRNIGTKTVSVMTNDAASTGMQTILISLYMPSARPDLMFHKNFMQGFLDGFVEGCRAVGCVYFSGETPQLKSKLYEDKLDIAGALFGLMPAGIAPISSSNLKAGNKIVFVESSGPHENGFTTLRDLAKKLPQGYRTKMPSGREFWEGINEGSKLYTPLVESILDDGIHPTNIEPITGHGWQKLMRPAQSLRYVVTQMLPMLEVFEFVERESGMNKEAMFTTFNCGTGLAIFVESDEEALRIVELARAQKLNAVVGGYVEVSESREVVLQPLNITLHGKDFALKK